MLNLRKNDVALMPLYYADVVVPAWYLTPIKSLPTRYSVEIPGNECTRMTVKLQYIMLVVLRMYLIVSSPPCSLACV